MTPAAESERSMSRAPELNFIARVSKINRGSCQAPMDYPAAVRIRSQRPVLGRLHAQVADLLDPAVSERDEPRSNEACAIEYAFRTL